MLGDRVPKDLAGLSSVSLLPAAAFLGALAATSTLYTVATRGGRTSVATMLLAGVALAALASSFTGVLAYVSDDRQLRDLTFLADGLPARRRELGHGCRARALVAALMIAVEPSPGRAVMTQAIQVSSPFLAHEIVRLGVDGIGRVSACERARIVEQSLSAADALPLAAQSYATLSGGEQRRVQFARALAQIAWPPGRFITARLFLLDEPVANLDMSSISSLCLMRRGGSRVRASPRWRSCTTSTSRHAMRTGLRS